MSQAPGFGECLSIDRWRRENAPALSDIEFLFWDLDGDTDPSVPDIGVRSEPAASDAEAILSEESLVLPRLVRNAWRALRDDAGGAAPPREARLALLATVLEAARMANDGIRPYGILGLIDALVLIERDVAQRSREAKKTVAGRPYMSRDIRWQGDLLHVMHLTIGSDFEPREAFTEMPGIDLLITHDPRAAPFRTALMADSDRDLSPLFACLYARLAKAEPGCWTSVRMPKYGPTPMILPPRLPSTSSRMGGNASVMFGLLEECAAL